MMINKRLISTVSESKKYMAANVAVQWCSLIANIVLMAGIAGFLQKLYESIAGGQRSGFYLYGRWPFGTD